MWRQFFKTLARKKPLDDTGESRLAKVLTAFDLTSLGVGSTLGVGVYVLAGEVAKEYAGPAVVISFFIAALTSVFAGLCYAEFGARVPKAGSAYAYSYVTIGEFVAFIIGWNLVLEYAIGSASVVKGLSTYLDSLVGYQMSDFFISIAPMNIAGFGKYPDIFAFIVTMVFSFGIAFGFKESTMINNIFTLLNLIVVIFVIIAGLFKVNFDNWNIPEEEVPEAKYGSGGFTPYGISGIIKGAAVCFYGFIGFDCIATAGEEAKNPRKTIPFAVIASLGMVFLAYFGISAVLTLMIPYFEQDRDAPLPYVFRRFGWTVAEYIVSIGAIFGLCASLMGSMFPLPRIVFAMSADGLLFKCLGDVSPKFHTPLKGTLITGFLCAILASIFNLSQLISMMSIGTLLAYSMVASSVLILRYKSDGGDANNNGKPFRKESRSGFLSRILNTSNSETSTKQTAAIVVWSTTLYCGWCLLFGLIVTKFEDHYEETTSTDIALLCIAAVPVVLTLYVISRQPISSTQIFFKVPLVPWLPGLSIFVNIFLMIKLDLMTWIRLSIWISVGLVIYFSYGFRKSEERCRMKRTSLTITTMRHHSLPNMKSSQETPLMFVSDS